MKYTAIFFFSMYMMCSCSHTQKATVTQEPAGSSIQNTMIADVNKMQQTGIDFFATGNDPVNWHLEMNIDDTVRFAADDGLSVKFGYNKLKKDINTERSIYTVKLEGGADVTITVIEKECTVSTVKMAFTRQVTFSYNKRSYTGCGKYLADNNLNNKWILEKIGSAVINPADYNKVPVFQFDLAKQKLTGNDGCNTIGGNIEVQGNRIKFSGIFATRMACNKKDISAIISTKISDRLVNYYFKDGKLYFYLIDDSLLVFTKG